MAALAIITLIVWLVTAWGTDHLPFLAGMFGVFAVAGGVDAFNRWRDSRAWRNPKGPRFDPESSPVAADRRRKALKVAL